MKNLGFNLIGYATSTLGLGEDLRSFADILELLDIPFSVTDVPTDASGRIHVQWGNLTTADYLTSFFFMSPAECERLYHSHPKLFSQPRHRIGYFLWELPDFPTTKVSALRTVDEIWCPTRFVQNSFCKVTRQLVLAIPLPVKCALPSRRDIRHELGISKDAFVVLYLFDIQSTIARKNPEAVIKSFLRFAGNKKDVFLVLKLNRWHTTQTYGFESLLSDRRIQIIRETLSPADISALYCAANCYLSLHRSEGFGRTLVEAMQHGLEIVTTDHSGPADFINSSNACLVDWKLSDVRPGDYPDAGNSWWAEPSVKSAAEKLHQIYEHPSRRRMFTALSTGQEFTPIHLAKRYAKLLRHYATHPRNGSNLVLSR